MGVHWTFEQRLAAYRAEGITSIVIMPGARTHNRDDETGRTFGPVHGVTIHHTAGDWEDDRDGAAFCYNGTASLPGPLCQDYVGEDGTLYVVGHGRCNHAGSTTQAVKDALLESLVPNLTYRTVGSETVDANDFMFGLEIENRGDGSDPYEVAQYQTAVRWAAAHCRFYGWNQNSAWGHKEITTRKPDPSFSMTTFRNDLQAALARPAGTWPNTPQEEDPVPNLLSGSNSVDVQLTDTWLPLALDADGGPVLAGPTGPVNAVVTLYTDTATPADAKIQGVFYLADADGSNPSNYLVIDKRGGGGHQFVHAKPVPDNKHLWFKARAVGAVVSLLHRDLSGSYHTA